MTTPDDRSAGRREGLNRPRDAYLRERRIGWFCAAAVVLIWVGFQITGRIAARSPLTAWDVSAMRYVGAFLAVLPILALRGLPRMAPHRLAAVVATAGIGFPLCAYTGFTLAPAAHAAVIMSAGLPVATSLLAWLFLREAPGRARLVSLGAVVAGALLLGLEAGPARPGAWQGDLCYAGAAFSWAAYTLLVRRWRLPALEATLAVGLYAAMAYLPVWWLLLPSATGQASLGALLVPMLYHGALAAVVAGLFYTRSVAALGPGPITLSAGAVPALVAIAAWLVLDEELGPAGIAGVTSACAGLVWGVAAARRA
ncbi:MAG TPA: DMT family transporter [Roseomonas sp.]